MVRRRSIGIGNALRFRMPVKAGLALTRKLKGDESTKHIPIVALTAQAMKGDKLETFDAGCDGYVSKPIDTRTLADYLAGFLPTRTHC